MTAAFVIALIAFLVACIVAWSAYVRGEYWGSQADEYAKQAFSAENKQREAEHRARIATEQAEDLEKERAQLADELSDAIRLRTQAIDTYAKQAEKLNKLTTSLDEERELRVKAEAATDQLHERISTAINVLQSAGTSKE